jgi:molybdopterin/thiamine biosynthesis adenylyltransferase
MDYTRQEDLVSSKIFNTPITIIGGGGIGSFTTLALAKMGFKDIAVYDDDIVEEHNIPNQFYPISTIGLEKVLALKAVVHSFTETDIITHTKRWDKSIQLTSGIVISAVDTMAVRTELYNALNATKCIFIDGRMGGHQLEIRTCQMGDKEDMKRYKKTLWKDSDTSPLPCTQKAVMYNVLMIASLIANQCRLTLEHKKYNREIIYDFETGMMISSNECMIA